MTRDLLAPYASPRGLDRRREQLARQLGAEQIVYGQSVAGAPLWAVRVPGLAPGLPRVLCCANIHGPELVSSEVALGLLSALATEDPHPLRRHAEIWVAPCLNPDGHRRTFELGGDAPLAAMRPNDNGVDLNRNFPLPYGRPRRTYGLPGAGSTTKGAATFIGEHPLSEPETAALDALVAEHDFVASADLHSFMGTVIPARVTDRRQYRSYRALCRAFAQAQPGRRYRRVANRIFDVFTGELEDHLHHNRRCWAVCVETFPILSSLRQSFRRTTTFWRFNPRDPAVWVRNDVPGILAFFAAALALPRPEPQAAGILNGTT